MIKIEYKNSKGELITEEQSINTDTFNKCYFKNDEVQKIERYFERELMGVSVYNTELNHDTIIQNNQIKGYKWIKIIETTEYENNYKLFINYNYSLNGLFNGQNIHLEDHNSEIVAHGNKDSEGNYDYDLTRKLFFDRDINPERELFECTYKENGKLWELYWNNLHIDDNGQESFVLLNNQEDIKKLIELTGISKELAEYYMSSEIIPDF